MNELSLLHPQLQARIVLNVAKATSGPSFLRRVKGWANLPTDERQGILQRVKDGGWSWRVEGGDLLVGGGPS